MCIISEKDRIWHLQTNEPISDVGKIALAVAHKVAAHFIDSVWLIGLLEKENSNEEIRKQ